MRCSIEQDACVLYVRSKTCESMLTQCSHTQIAEKSDGRLWHQQETPLHRMISSCMPSSPLDDDKTRQKKSCYSKPMFLYTHPPACGKRQSLFDQREESLIHILCHLSAFPKGNPIFDQPECLVK